MANIRLGINYEGVTNTLLERVPTVDECGKPLGDMLVILPKLRDKPRHQIEHVARGLDRALCKFSDQVMFAELNINRNTLWVSMRPVKGIRLGIAEAIQLEVPEAKLVAHL